ncbi:hypothetical protein yberc0001_24530 [Yersinia bercovieri ATCC 43970]|uniref:Uncharacterized protein n=1 Tax=Yersinia bercovieri ATCC 43970 TaxID=349968 RepID=A0ABM9Y0V8_YERBE|nr:hypothetical protein yberc0001_24530 [Yersinia bercovieri ATCC 43970]
MKLIIIGTKITILHHKRYRPVMTPPIFITRPQSKPILFQ